jgi:hypothetical protein
VRVAVEHCGDDLVRSLCDRAAYGRIDVVGRTAQQAGKRVVGGGLAPLAEQVEDEEKRPLSRAAAAAATLDLGD